jgi:SAM-dependent methyltransferase
MIEMTQEAVTRALAARLPLYSWRRPVYQYVALDALRRMWEPSHRRLLDVGGGTGVIAKALKTFFALERVVSIDVEDRFLKNLDIETRVYDGEKLPFPDAAFDCVTLFNVLHHVPLKHRAPLLGECRRVAGGGPVYIKDHLSTGAMDAARLAALDVLGNAPFHGMVRARYLTEEDWSALRQEAGFREEARLSGDYRDGVFAALFPNRLEISMKWSAV